MTRMSQWYKRLIHQSCIELQTYTARQVHERLMDETRRGECLQETRYSKGVTYRQIVRYLRTDPESTLIKRQGDEVVYRFTGQAGPRPIDVELQELRSKVERLEVDHQTVLKFIQARGLVKKELKHA